MSSITRCPEEQRVNLEASGEPIASHVPRHPRHAGSRVPHMDTGEAAQLPVVQPPPVAVTAAPLAKEPEQHSSGTR
jgi:hypothetical protein